MKFNEHGHFQVACDGNIIYYKVVGMWNKEASLNCITQLRDCFLRLAREPIAMIVDTSEFEGGIPEAFELWRAEFYFWFENNLKAFIRIDDENSIHYQLFLAKIDEKLQQNVYFEFAESFDQALTIAKQRGFLGFVDTNLPTE